jgi:hypothetical protein
MRLSEIGASGTAEGDGDRAATVTGNGLADKDLEQAALRLAAEPGLARVRWQALDEA